MKYKYVLATCAVAGQLQNHKLPVGHFNVVAIDEAGLSLTQFSNVNILSPNILT